MLSFLVNIQTSIMLFLSGGCGVLFILALNTKTLTPQRRHALVFMELGAMLLLLSDYFAYMYRGDTTFAGFYGVRISNFLVYFLSLFLNHEFNIYLMDLCKSTGKFKTLPIRFSICEALYLVGTIILVVSQFTNLYYTFDETNHYVRAGGFLISYLFPLGITLLQLTIIVQFMKILGKKVTTPLFMFTILPYVASIMQIMAYGLSLTNITMVGLVVLLYFLEIRNMNQLQAQKIAAERASTAKSRFLANMSHEIRTPINTIMGMDEMILRENPEGVPKEYLNAVTGYAVDIKAASESLLGLINDVLDISKIESGKVHLVEQDYNVNDLLHNIVTMIRVKSDEKGLEFRLDIDESIPQILHGDMGKIKQIVLNLLTNAVKYTDNGGFKLTVKMLENNDGYCKLLIAVKDTGIGIKASDMESLFSAFARLDEVKNSNIQGTGLGLDISKQFAALMGGTLTCESIYGEGSTFKLIIDQMIVNNEPIGPFEEGRREHVSKHYLPQFMAPDAGILAVDDNPMNLAVIQGLLKSTGMYIVTASSGEECLKKLQENDFNLVLLDHMMPGMDGIETLKRIREAYPALPVLALTANYTQNGEQYYKSYGFDGYLPKPIDGPTLEKAIRMFLPDYMVMDNEVSAYEDAPEVLPDDMAWLYDTEGISVEKGVEFSGSIDNFLYSARLFAEAIDDNSKTIEDAWKNGDIKLFTIKVHALKSSAKIIGASELSSLSLELENAGNNEDKPFIEKNIPKLLELYKSYKDKLSRLLYVKKDEDNSKPLIPDEDLKSAYEAIKELADQMDYDGCKLVIDNLNEYSLPKEDASKFKQIEKSLKVFDWDTIESLLQ